MAWTFGSEYVFNSATTDSIYTIKLDDTHIVVVYQDTGNSNYGTCIVGTIANDDEISWGNEYVYSSGSGHDKESICKIDSTHFAIVWRGWFKIATVSNGNELSFSSLYTHTSGYNIYQAYIALLDSTHLVIYYADSDFSPYGRCKICTLDGSYAPTFGSAYSVGALGIFHHQGSIVIVDSTHFVTVYGKYSKFVTVSNGNELSFSSEVAYDSLDTQAINTVLIDSTHFMISYYKPYWKGAVIIGTISSGSISYGTAVLFKTNSDTKEIYFTTIALVDSSHFLIFYCNNSNYAYVIPGTLSSYTPSFGSATNFNSNNTIWLESCLIDEKHVNVVYKDSGNSNYGTACIYYNPDIILQFDATIDYSLDYSFPLSSILETTASLSYDYDIESDAILKSSISSPINYDIDYPSPITGSSSFNSIIDYDYSYFILGQEKYISPFNIDYSVDYSADVIGFVSIPITIEYDYDIISPVDVYYTIPVVIEYDYDILATSDGSGKIDAIIDYDYDWASWYEWDGRENRSYSSIRLVNSSYSIGKKQDNRNSKAQITASGLTPAQLQSLANTIPTLEDSKQSRGK